VADQQWNIRSYRDGDDIVAQGMATDFHDASTSTGIPADREGIIACALPRGNCPETEGSPFVGVSNLTLVRVYSSETGKYVVCPVIDEGPAWIAEAGTGSPGSAMVDLTPAARSALGLADNAEVTIRILAGSERIVADARAGIYDEA
jgi:hypothetical protein